MKTDSLEKVAKAADLEIQEMLSNLPQQDVEFVDEELEHDPVIHSPVVSVQPATPMTVMETNICELYSTGMSTKGIAEELGIEPYTVRNVLAKPHIKDFVSELINAQYTTSIEGRLRVINKIIDAKLEKIEEEYNGDFSKATKKDVVDLLMIADGMLKERQKKELGTSDNVYLSIVNQITGE